MGAARKTDSDRSRRGKRQEAQAEILKYHQQKEDSKRALIRSVDCEVDWKAEAELKG